MSRLTSTVLLILVLAGLVGYIYFADQPSEDTAKPERAFTGVSADDVDEVSITTGGQHTTVRRTGDAWKVVEPLEADADGGELSSIVASLGTLDVQRVVDEKPSDLKQYGLDPARIEVAFKTKADKTPKRVLFGEKAPAGGDLYAKLPDSPRVFLVSSYLDSTFNRDTFALRDKTILKFERAKVDGFTVTDGSTRLRFKKSGQEWSIVEPIAARADFAAVEGALERLGSARMQGVTADAAPDLGPYGLDKPTTTFAVTAGSATATLTLGRTENALVFARDGSRSMVFTVAPTLRTDVVKPVDDFRRKDLFDFRSFTATRVEVTRGTDTLVLEKTKGADGKDAWKNGAGKTLDATKVDDALTKLSSLRAQSFEAGTHASLKTPAVVVTAAFDKRTETASIGRAGADAFAVRTGEPGQARVDTAALDDALKALDALK